MIRIASRLDSPLRSLPPVAASAHAGTITARNEEDQEDESEAGNGRMALRYVIGRTAAKILTGY